MIDIRPFSSLGKANFGWLNANHHFSFGHYRNPDRDQWGRLRVWNDDEIAPGTGFDPHPHRDMEIITYVREGAITHKDNLGNEGRTEAGDVQIMSAGTGVVHAEYNLEPATTRIFQIWIMPEQRGLPPSWGNRPFPRGERSGAWVVLASGLPGDDQALPIRANARVLAASLAAGQTLQYSPQAGRKLYLVPALGTLEVNGVRAECGDGLAIAGEELLQISAHAASEIVLVDAA